MVLCRRLGGFDEGSAGLAPDAVGRVWEKAEDDVPAIGISRFALKVNPNKVGSAGADGAVAGVDCAK